MYLRHLLNAPVQIANKMGLKKTSMMVAQLKLISSSIKLSGVLVLLPRFT
jgi:hypothetical protein